MTEAGNRRQKGNFRDGPRDDVTETMTDHADLSISLVDDPVHEVIGMIEDDRDRGPRTEGRRSDRVQDRKDAGQTEDQDRKDAGQTGVQDRKDGQTEGHEMIEDDLKDVIGDHENLITKPVINKYYIY